MKYKYSISYFILITAIVLAFIYAYAFNYEHQVDNFVMIEESIPSDEFVISNSEDVISSGYYIREVDGYLVVYLHDDVTVFIETDILLSDLDMSLQMQVMDGKYVETDEELYAILENYSS